MKQTFRLIFLLCCCSCGEEQKLVNLRMSPEPGKTWIVNSRTINSSLMGTKNFSDTVFFNFELSLVKADSTGNRLRMRVTRLGMMKPIVTGSVVVKTGAKSVSMDLSGFMANRFKVYEAVQDDTLLLVVSNTGALIMEDGYDRLAEKLAKKTGVDESEVRYAIRDYLGTGALSDFLKGLFFYLPADDIEHQRSWVTNTMFTALAPVKHSNMISVDSVTDNQVQLHVEAQISAGEEGSRYRTGTKKGSMSIDKKSGFILEMTLDEESTINAPGSERRIFKNTVIRGSLQ